VPNVGFPELLLLGWLIVVLPFWRIFSKAGYPGWYSLSQLVPILNVVALFYLAFAEWPSRRYE